MIFNRCIVIRLSVWIRYFSGMPASCSFTFRRVFKDPGPKSQRFWSTIVWSSFILNLNLCALNSLFVVNLVCNCNTFRSSMFLPGRAQFTFLLSRRLEPFMHGAVTRRGNLDLAIRKTGNARPWLASWADIASSRWPPEEVTLYFWPVSS